MKRAIFAAACASFASRNGNVWRRSSASSMKQVAHIRQISRALRIRFGERKMIDGTVVYTFPSAARLARTSENELRACALGYRAKNLPVDGAAGRSRRSEPRGMVALCRMMNCARVFANCPASAQRWQTASCYLPTNACARSRSMSGSNAFCARNIFREKESRPRASCANLRNTILASMEVTRSNTYFITRARGSTRSGPSPICQGDRRAI